jgi:peptidoglycan hydrolase-like protein with peptidoglycan-binding domain
LPTSQNGFSANDRSVVSARAIPGTDIRVTVRNGPAGDLLLYAAGRWDKEVEDIDNVRGALDDWGYAERPIRGGTTLSNHASGTAVDLNATQHPLGTDPAKTFTPTQIASIRKILRDCGGALRWGGDYTGRKDPMHVEVIAPTQRCAQVLLNLHLADNKPAGKWPTIRRGSVGPAVETIQRFLGVQPVSGVFGPLTESAVRKYQRMRGLDADGVVGDLTWRATELKETP